MDENKIKKEVNENTIWYTNLKCFLGGWLFGRVGVGAIIAIIDMGSRCIKDLIEWGII